MDEGSGGVWGWGRGCERAAVGGLEAGNFLVLCIPQGVVGEGGLQLRAFEGVGWGWGKWWEVGGWAGDGWEVTEDFLVLCMAQGVVAESRLQLCYKIIGRRGIGRLGG